MASNLMNGEVADDCNEGGFLSSENGCCGGVQHRNVEMGRARRGRLNC